MKKIVGKVWMFILGWLCITLLIVFLVQSRMFYGNNPIVRQRIETVEAFESRVEEKEAVHLNGMSPADDTSVTKPKESYSLLLDWLTLATEPKYIDADDCRSLDFQTRLERTGNFRQLTNNYKRGDPDSCSGPIQDLTLAFYKTTPIPD
jgi:hypothetical protein